MTRILFVCTGNIFRSLTAEYALRRALQGVPGIHVSSAGTEDFPHVVRPVVSDYLLGQGLDVSAHRRRTLTQSILAQSHVVVAMSTDHRAFLLERFERAVPLFTDVCGDGSGALPDVDEVVPNYETNAAGVAAHVKFTIDRILGLTPRLARRIIERDATLLPP